MGLVLLVVVETMENHVWVKAATGPHFSVPAMVFTRYIQSTVL